MKKISFVFICALMIGLVGCTENTRAKSFGGTANVSLKPGHKLVNVTWKESQLWFLTRPMRADEKPETYSFSEESSWGVIEGTVLIREQTVPSAN